MANISVATESCVVVADGSVITSKKEILTVDFSNSAGTLLKIKFGFLDDPEKQQLIETKVSPDASYLSVTIFNAVGLGGTTEPLQVASDDETNKKLFLSLAFQQISESYVLHYTIFEQK
jgi:hypothetical protein